MGISRERFKMWLGYSCFHPSISTHSTFFCYRTSISTQIAAQPCSFSLALHCCARTCWLHWLPSLRSARGITAPYTSQGIRRVSHTLAVASLYHETCCGGYSQIVPWHVEKGIGEWNERETFISHYMIAAWWHLHFHIGYIHPLQSRNDSNLTIVTK